MKIFGIISRVLGGDDSRDLDDPAYRDRRLRSLAGPEVPRDEKGQTVKDEHDDVGNAW